MVVAEGLAVLEASTDGAKSSTLLYGSGGCRLDAERSYVRTLQSYGLDIKAPSFKPRI